MVRRVALPLRTDKKYQHAIDDDQRWISILIQATRKLNDPARPNER
jgi:hypothetical protein